ncbi:MAG: tetratricopeptide repeat protein [Cyanobacteria bacterium P01_G01_bin.39]
MSSNREITNLAERTKIFWESNQQVFKQLLTFIDFADDKLNVAFAEINFAQDRDLLIKTLIEHPNCQDIQFMVLDFPDPELRFLRDEIVKALKSIEIDTDKKLILLLKGLEKSIGILDEYPDILVNLNYVRDDFRHSVSHPIIFFLPEYALTRLAKYAPDFWAWSRKIFTFKTVKSGLVTIRDSTLHVENSESLNLPEKEARINLLQRLLSEYKFDQIEKKRNLSTVANLYNELGNTLFYTGKYQQAINCHQQSLKFAQKIKDRHEESKSLNNLGNAYRSLGEYQRAIDYHQQSLAIKQQTGNRNGEAKSLSNLGNAYNSLGEYQRAIDYHQKSLAIKQQIGDKKGEASCLNNLGTAYSSLGEYQRAIDYYQQSLAIQQQIGDRHGQGKSLNNLGSAYYSLGEYQQAINFFQQSLAIQQQIGNRHDEAASLNNLGSAYYSLGEYQRAIDYHQKSLAIKQQIGDKKGEASCLNNLGNAYSSLGEYPWAINFYQQSLAITQQIGDKKGQANSWFNLGNTHHNLQQKSEAKVAYENARRLYQAMELNKDVEDCDQAIQNLDNDLD